MNCTIDAWLDDDTAHLRITDTDSGRVHLDWCWSGSETTQGDADTALHRLVSGLFLVSCIGKLRHASAPAQALPTERIPAKQWMPSAQRIEPEPPAEPRIIEFRRAAGHS